MASASSVLRALRQRSTHGCSPSISRRPQCTTSWSSTTSTRRRRSLEPVAIRLGFMSTVNRHRQTHAPRAGVALAELDDAAELERLQRRELEAHPGLLRAAADAVVADVEYERSVLALEADLYARGLRVLVGVSHRLGEHGLRERLELLGQFDALGAGPEHEPEVAVLLLQARDLFQQRRVRLGRAAAERSLQGPAEVEQRGLQLGSDALAGFGTQLRLAGEHELDPEQALDHGFVDLTREVHPFLQLAGLGLLVGGEAGERGKRGGLAERVEQRSLRAGQRRAAGPAIGQDHAEPAARGGHRG